MSASISRLLLSMLFIASAMPAIFGGLNDVSIREALANPEFKKADKAAKSQFYNTHKVELGEIISVKSQVVAGINYLIKYRSPKGPVEA